MKILIIQANQKLYSSEGKLNQALAMTAKTVLAAKHEVVLSDIAAGIWNVQEEVAKLKQADRIIYHFPLWWFGVPNVLKRYLDEVLIHKETFLSSEIYGEGGQLRHKSFMIAVTSNLKKEDLGTVPILQNYHNSSLLGYSPSISYFSCR